MKSLFFALILGLSVSHFSWGKPIKQFLHVKGMVCELCAQGVKKKFMEQPEVKEVKVLVKSQEVVLTYKDEAKTIDEKRLKEIVEDLGYELHHAD